MATARNRRFLPAAGSCEAKMQLSNAEDWVIQAVTFKTVSANFGLDPGRPGDSQPRWARRECPRPTAIAVNAINGFTVIGGSGIHHSLPVSQPGDGLGCSVTTPASVKPGQRPERTYSITTVGSHPASKPTRNAITVTGTSGTLSPETATVSLG